MVDEEIKDLSAGPTGAPVNRDARREPDVIEGEIAARGTDDHESPPDPPAAEPLPAAAPAPAPRAAARGFLGGAIAGLIVSALGLGAGYSLLAPKGDVSETANRLSAIETQTRQDSDAIAAEANRGSAAIASLEKRLGALESSAGASNTSDLDKRVTALESASSGNGAASEATQRLAAQAKDLRADVDAEKGEIPELSGRISKLETEAQKTNAAGLRSRHPRRPHRQDRGCARCAEAGNACRRRQRDDDRHCRRSCRRTVAFGRCFRTPARRPATSGGRCCGPGAAGSGSQRRAHQQRAGHLVQRSGAARLSRHVSAGHRQRDGSFPRASPWSREGART